MRRTLLTRGLGASVAVLLAVSGGLGLPGLMSSVYAEGCPDTGPCVVVDVVGSVTASRTFSLPEVLALGDRGAADYPTRSEGSAPRTTALPAATSLRALVAAVPNPSGAGTVDPDQVTYTEVFDHETSHPIGRGDLGPSGANGYAGGFMPVVYQVGRADAVGYLRPLHDDADVDISADPNLGGYFQTLSHGSLHVTVHTTGQLLPTSVDAATTSPQVNQAVALTAVVDAPAGASWSWSFGRGDPGTASTRTTSHTWTAAGSYDVVVSVRGSDGSFGRSSPLTVQVGAAPTPTPTPSPAPGSGTTGGPKSPSSGPQSSTGHNNGGKPGSKPGTADTGTQGTDGTTGGVTGAAPLVSGLVTGTGRPATSAPAAPFAPVYQPPLIGLLSGQSPSATQPGTTTGQATPLSVTPAEGSVTGMLLVSAPGSPSSSVPGAKAGSRSRGEAGSTSPARRLTEQSRGPIPAWVLLPLLLVLLLGAGAVGESPLGDRLRTRWQVQLWPRLRLQVPARLRRTSTRRRP